MISPLIRSRRFLCGVGLLFLFLLFFYVGRLDRGSEQVVKGPASQLGFDREGMLRERARKREYFNELNTVAIEKDKLFELIGSTREFRVDSIEFFASELPDSDEDKPGWRSPGWENQWSGWKSSLKRSWRFWIRHLRWRMI